MFRTASPIRTGQAKGRVGQILLSRLTTTFRKWVSIPELPRTVRSITISNKIRPKIYLTKIWTDSISRTIERFRNQRTTQPLRLSSMPMTATTAYSSACKTQLP